MPKLKGPKLTQTEKAHTALKKAILHGDLQEGVFLSESDIMRRYAIGRTPYREACNRLHHEGLLEVVPRRGYLIPEVSFHEVRDVFEMRLILEGAVAELAAARASDQDIAELEELVNKPLSSAIDEFEEWIQANIAFHLRLAQTTRNREIVELLTRNLEKTERLMYIELNSSRVAITEFRLLHSRIVEALRTRDPNAVREAVLDDITLAQSATLTLGNRAPVSALANNGVVRSTKRD
jgi:DNA-binding GntR family transcriptional regulator